jgi:hypothetical protein
MARRAMTTTTRPRVTVWAAATGAALAARSPPLRRGWEWAVDVERRLGASGGGGGGATDFLGMRMARREHISYIEIRSRNRMWV